MGSLEVVIRARVHARRCGGSGGGGGGGELTFLLAASHVSKR